MGFSWTISLIKLNEKHEFALETRLLNTYSTPTTIRANDDHPKSKNVKTNLMACAPGRCVSIELSSPTVNLMISFLSSLSLMDTDSLSMRKLTFMSSNYKKYNIVIQYIVHNQSTIYSFLHFDVDNIG